MFGEHQKYNIKGYKWIGKNRKNKNGGGVGILVSNSIANKTTEITDIEENENLETCWIKINTRPADLHIGVFYGPQESDNRERNKSTYQYLETQIKQLRKRGEIIIGGDFNAKLEIKSKLGDQHMSKNGQLLQEIISNNNLDPITTKAEVGHWTRVNRNNPKEKSIIDYILMSETPAKNRGLTIIDEEGQLRIKGKNETDHNTIITSIKISDKRHPRFIERWKKGTPDQWRSFNEQMNEIEKQGKWDQGYNDTEQQIKKVLKNTIGKIKIRTDKTQKTKTPEITKYKEIKKARKTEYAMELATKEQSNPAQIKHKQIEYMKAIKDHRDAIETEEKKRTEERMNKISQEAKKNRNIIWQIRKKTKSNNELEYNTITEDGQTITDPEETKKHIQEWYEELYQARPGTPEYQDWTNRIKQKTMEIQKEYNTNEASQGSEPITMKELNQAIGKLKTAKSTGPDDIPNEIFIRATNQTRETYLKILNKIHTNENIPEPWKKGNIKRLYKGKGMKGKCSNERGITLASNFGKIYERIINNRIKPIIKMTEAQAGGIEGNATVDHLIVLKHIINEIRKQKKTAYIAFLDVKKAYDKAWLDAILYVLDKNGVKGKNWQMARLMNTDLRANIMTKYGLTDEIKIRDSIRQGGVLSVIEYAVLIDEISKELGNKDLGIEIENTKIGCLLWMDDVALIHHDRATLQRMMDTTEDIAKRYHIEFGVEKCKVVKIGPGRKSKIILNNKELEETTNYKYLGEIINNKANLKDHIEELKGKAEAAKQKIFTETGNSEFKGIKMQAIWQLLDASIIPIITYASEGWIMTKKEQEDIQKILNKIIREVLKVPESTPVSILLHETGYKPITQIIEKKKIMQAIRIEKKNNKMIKEITKNQEGKWRNHVNELMEKYQVIPEDSKHTADKLIEEKQRWETAEEIRKEAQSKSKVKHWMDRTDKITPGTRPEYMKRLSRKQCSAILKVRTRMIPVKENMKGSVVNNSCRWCKTKPETQEHIIDECPEFNKQLMNQNITYNDMFKNQEISKMTEIAEHAINIITIIEENQTSIGSP